MGEASSATVAPSPLRDRMGAVIHDGGCTFRVWAPFATAVDVRLWATGAGGATRTVSLAGDVADGFGAGCWSAFVAGVADEDHYRFVVTAADGGLLERVDAFGRSVAYPNWTDASRDDSDARSVVARDDFPPGPAFDAPGWRELVIYQLHVGTFFDPDAAAAAGAASRLDGLINQIAHLRRLGVNAVQFLPFTEFSSRLSLGYNSVLPYAIERDCGRPWDFKRLVRALHDAGMRVLTDVVYNHVDVSDWRGTLPYSLFAYDGWHPASNSCGVFFYGGEEMNTPWGAPRPDYGRAEVRRYLRDNALMWLEEYQVDGLRFDSTKCVRLLQGPCGGECCGGDLGNGGRNFGWELLQEINGAVDARQPWKLTVAEDLGGNAAITAPAAEGGAGFDAQWDTDVMDAVVEAITRATDDAVDVGRVARAVEHAFEGDPFRRVIYLESHDQAKSKRVPDAVRPGDAEGWYARKKSMLGAGVVLTSPGIPMLFQGCEFLDWRQWGDGVPLEWSRVARFPRLLQFYCDLVRLRTNAAGRTRGLCGPGVHVIQANPVTKVLAYHRWDAGGGADDVVVVANFSGTTFPSYTVGWPYPGTWHVRLNSDANVYSDANDFGAVDAFDTTAWPVAWDGMPCAGNVGLGPYSLLVLSR